MLHRGRSFVAGRRLHARELALGPCEGILIHYAGFKLWRERLRCAGILDTYQQLGYDVYQVLQTLAAEKKQPLLFRQFWNLTPLAHDVALERADEIPLRQSEAYDDAARAADIIISTRDLDVTLPAGWGRDELIRAKLIWTCNSHAFGPDGLDCGCFPGIARALNHSCDPNCRVSVDGDGRLSVFAGDREVGHTLGVALAAGHTCRWASSGFPHTFGLTSVTWFARSRRPKSCVSRTSHLSSNPAKRRKMPRCDAGGISRNTFSSLATANDACISRRWVCNGLVEVAAPVPVWDGQEPDLYLRSSSMEHEVAVCGNATCAVCLLPKRSVI